MSEASSHLCEAWLEGEWKVQKFNYYMELVLVITGLRYYCINVDKKIEWNFLSSYLGTRKDPVAWNLFWRMMGNKNKDAWKCSQKFYLFNRTILIEYIIFCRTKIEKIPLLWFCEQLSGRTPRATKEDWGTQPICNRLYIYCETQYGLMIPRWKGVSWLLNVLKL